MKSSPPSNVEDQHCLDFQDHPRLTLQPPTLTLPLTRVARAQGVVAHTLDQDSKCQISAQSLAPHLHPNTNHLVQSQPKGITKLKSPKTNHQDAYLVYTHPHCCQPVLLPPRRSQQVCSKRCAYCQRRRISRNDIP
jgi:hypothetical protein